MRTQCFVCFFCQSDAESSWNKNVHPSWCIIYLDHNSTSYFPYDSKNCWSFVRNGHHVINRSFIWHILLRRTWWESCGFFLAIRLVQAHSIRLLTMCIYGIYIYTCTIYVWLYVYNSHIYIHKHILHLIFYLYTTSGNQTWRLEIVHRWRFQLGNPLHMFCLFHCNVSLPEGMCIYLSI